MERLPELKFLGQSLEWNDYAQFEYKGFYISLHLTITGNTRVRLQREINDPVFYKCHCDWCTGGMNHISEGIISDLFVIDSFSLMLWCVDNECVNEMPFSSNIRPIWNDPEFMGWFEGEKSKVPAEYFFAVNERLRNDVDRQEFLNALVRDRIRNTISFENKIN